MKVAVFSTKPYDRSFLESANVAHGHELWFLGPVCWCPGHVCDGLCHGLKHFIY